MPGLQRIKPKEIQSPLKVISPQLHNHSLGKRDTHAHITKSGNCLPQICSVKGKNVSGKQVLALAPCSAPGGLSPSSFTRDLRWAGTSSQHSAAQLRRANFTEDKTCAWKWKRSMCPRGKRDPNNGASAAINDAA